MKKTFRMAIGILMAVCLLCTAAFAASPTNTVTVTGDPAITINPEGDACIYRHLTAAEATKLAKADKTLNVVWQACLHGSDGTKLTFNVSGYNDTVYVYHYVGGHTKDGTWELVGQGKGPTVTITAPSFSAYAVAIKTGTSPKTGETALPYVALGVAVAAAAAAVLIRRRDEA